MTLKADSYFANQETTPFSNWLWTDLCIGYINLDALYANRQCTRSDFDKNLPPLLGSDCKESRLVGI